MNFVNIIITIAGVKGKEQSIVATNPRLNEDDYNIQDRVNGAKIPPVDRKAPALAAEKAPADQDILAPANRKALVDQNAPADQNVLRQIEEDALATANGDIVELIDRDASASADKNTSVPVDENASAPADRDVPVPILRNKVTPLPIQENKDVLTLADLDASAQAN